MQWYYQENGEEQCPFSEARIRELILFRAIWPATCLRHRAASLPKI